MSDSVCATIALGDSNLGDTPIAHDRSGRIAGLVRKKRKGTFPDGGEETGIRKRQREDSDVLVQQTTPEGLIDIQCRKCSCLDKECYIIGTDSVTLYNPDLARQLLIEKISLLYLTGSALDIGSAERKSKSFVESPIISCLDLGIREISSMSGRLSTRINVDYLQVITKSIHMWGTKVCVKVWEADSDIGDCDYSKILQKVKHQNRHRIYEEEKRAIRDRSGSVIQWHLLDMRVTVDVLQRQ
ncbi:hypothetical protein DL95DRAFT_414527 [Leptodontidium sp. 2 PMI_412]|nr:hypothetical protein DL95DRAFT_414527 [Leptodontidium sp. 2 PMI_412]